ncbi:ABC transporter permease [Bacillus sp. FJAT-28004]|uniref:ABC transporter permease n=1 Tax=Bacillus sp. FJAT-28004 TaxID=1679165 RepID=UPI0006B5E072|nr:ABC transporter permease [Bacillus sp. FJAT-28004]
MIKLMKLEIAKMGLGWYVKAAIIANVVIVMLMFMISYFEGVEGKYELANMGELYIIIGAMVRSTFIVMASVLISKLIIDEYKKKTIFVMFMYPVSRKKLLAAKLAIVALLTFIAIVISHIFTLSTIIGINHFFHIIEEAPVALDYGSQLTSIVTFAFAAAGASLVPLYFGMRKHSVPATILSSLLIVMLTSSSNPVFSLATIIYIPLGLAAIGVAIAWATVRNIEQTDVL